MRNILKDLVAAIEVDDEDKIERAYQNALAVLQEPDTAPAEAKAVETEPAAIELKNRCGIRSAVIRQENETYEDLLEIAGPYAVGPLYRHPAPAPAAAELQYKSMFEAAISALAAIDDALGIDADGCNAPEITLDEIRRLKAAAEADKRDAERYRFIRDGGEGTDIAVREFDDDGDEVWIHGYPPEELDAAIDDAIAAQKEADK